MRVRACLCLHVCVCFAIIAAVLVVVAAVVGATDHAQHSL